MKADKRKKLEKAGWRVGSAADFLALKQRDPGFGIGCQVTHDCLGRCGSSRVLLRTRSGRSYTANQPARAMLLFCRGPFSRGHLFRPQITRITLISRLQFDPCHPRHPWFNCSGRLGQPSLPGFGPRHPLLGTMVGIMGRCGRVAQAHCHHSDLREKIIRARSRAAQVRDGDPWETSFSAKVLARIIPVRALTAKARDRTIRLRSWNTGNRVSLPGNTV
jgi:hypothetical protein